MDDPRDIILDRGWLIMLRDVGISAEDALRRTGLPLEFLHQETSRLAVAEFFALGQAVDDLAGDPLLALRIGQAVTPEAFAPPVFAALCSSTLASATRRLATHKRLMAPVAMTIDETADGLVVSWAWDDPTVQVPRFLLTLDLVFLVQLARIATRERVEPIQVTCPVELEPANAYLDYFGTQPIVGDAISVTFDNADAHRPFLTASEALWASFEPELQRRTSKLEAEQSMTERTGSVLLECLPSGEATLQHAARRLGVSARTLQRRLTDEGITFRAIVQTTREKLARHYLSNTALPYREISFLLGFDEPSSFFRAFHTWSGQTPETFRTNNR
ncbi:MAG: AraC family transcriptional regulator ligand-binding domain-containing protein [Ilumatobacter sp.]